MSRPTRGSRAALPVRACHPLWSAVPDASGSPLATTGLVPVRSPLLRESRLMSFPPGTEMVQFPGFAPPAHAFDRRYRSMRWVAPFGDPRITGRSPLPAAYRSVPRPSSPLGAKASTRCPRFARPAPAPEPSRSRTPERPSIPHQRSTATGPHGRTVRPDGGLTRLAASQRRAPRPSSRCPTDLPPPPRDRPTTPHDWWARAESNGRPHPYQGCALTD